MTAGKLITLEGGEGTGKSTQACLLADHLRLREIEAVLTREPGGVAFAERLRDMILEKSPASPKTEFLLFAAARCEHIAELIEPALTSGQWVICDRYIDSTRVYQGRVAGIVSELIGTIETHTVEPFMPDLTIMLDVAPKIGLERAKARGAMTRYDEAGLEAHEAIRQGFLDVAAAEPDRCVVIDGLETVADIAAQISGIVDRRFGLAV